MVAHRAPRFHPLPVAAVDHETEDSVVVTFAVPQDLRDDFRWLPGQHVTLRMPGVEPEVRRAYSICSAPGSPLRVGIKRVDGGQFSTWAASSVRVGDELDVMTPTGHFVVDCDGTAARHVVAIAAGSGITPVRSIVESVLALEPRSTVTLVCVNRTALDAMFLHELAQLKDRYVPRLALWHVLTREGRDPDLLSGHVDLARAGELIDRHVIPADADVYFLCGPTGFLDGVRLALSERAVPSERIHVELFTAAAPSPNGPVSVYEREQPSVVASATVVLDGRATTVEVVDGEAVLDAAVRVRPDAPYSCRSGACSTCRALLREGSATMARTSGLDDGEIEAGYILTCQARPASPRLVVDFDA